MSIGVAVCCLISLTHDSNESGTDAQRNEETNKSTGPDLNTHTTDNLLDAAVVVRIVLTNSLGHRLTGRQTAGGHELLDEREKDRHDNGGFDRLTCLR